jgi:hypothetical protein
MTNTWPHSSQKGAAIIAEQDLQAAPASPTLALAAITLSVPVHTLTAAPAAPPPPAVDICSTDTAATPLSSPTPQLSEDWRADLKARYKAMPTTTWFKTAHEGRSLGDTIKVEK